MASAARPEEPSATAEARAANLLDIDDVLGKRIVATRLRGNITVREENATAALEVMSRFALDPRWLVYLPPTMSPCDSSRLPGMLEHPTEVFTYFRNNGVSSVVCEEKHMGSRAIVVAGRDAAAIERRFGITGEGIGACYTRTGRRFFEDRALEAQELLREQYAAVGAAARVSLTAAEALLRQTAERGIDASESLPGVEERLRLAQLYSDAYARYCWPVTSLADIRLAPFHLMASEGQVHTDKAHLWHMDMAERLCRADPGLFQATRHQVVDLNAPDELEAIRWWDELTGKGGEGMVVKPMDFITTGKRGMVQPAMKCRGPEYLRIIYGPEYTLPENIERLRNRGLSTKRSLALREFALGVEGLRRFVEEEPLYRVHECAFAVLALESEPVDPRL